MVDLERSRRPPTPRRLGIVVALVVSMMLTLFARLYYVQLLDPNKPVQSAHLTHDGVIVVPAPRGLIVDSQGNVLVANTSTRIVTVDRDLLQRRADRGAAVLKELGALLETAPATLAREITPCSPTVPAPCSTGEPFAPVPVMTDAPMNVVLAISEHREAFPGVEVQTVTVPAYPGGSLAAHLLGYTSEITEADKKANPNLVDADTIGVSGLEQQYDSVLRGVDGKQLVQLNPQGYTVGSGTSVPAQQGDTLVTSIDARVQKLAESSLAQQIKDSRKKGKKATSGAVVVIDPNTGRIIASASYPTYKPSLFIGGISNSDYRTLTDPSAGVPLLDRAIAGEYAPGSTFKLITSSSLVMHKQINTTDRYGCPGSVSIDGRVKTNYASEVLGPVNLRDALGYSCDTFFYVPTADEYYADQARLAKGKKANEFLQRMAAAYGVGRSPGVDLPAGEQSTGSFADRETRMARWKANRSDYCKAARRGYPEIGNRSNRAYLTELASENCTDGWRYRAGDNADMSIGQGETTMSPLQLALAYSALVNGGKIFEPTLGWAVVDAKGKVVRTIDPKVHNRVPVSQSLLNYITTSLDFSRGWAVSGAFAYLGSKYQNRIGGKTGTAEVYGQQDTSWLATWGPTFKDAKGNTRAHFVMVGMIEQGGTGATAAGPMLKRIWDALFGVDGKPLLPGIRPDTTLPTIAPQVSTVTKR
ncbi:MAG TPA: penicillin-binding transpeptidase domain-containing protein [Jatrophihabitans sp.]|jgi:penicillin-binding protein 2|uniref:penicillin-binding transpeptidase domain-containing protein n=1 Tax=Jatrophihabitans sp. TaxID=1932789 RepID=UPI002E0B1758|nr:penicillin-binding transpeptidase domain-containing protein [Jatrophihabitans sp.]